MDDDDSRITDLARIFRTLSKAGEMRAADPEAFVRLAYIAKSALDRLLGAANPHSAQLVELCDTLETPETTAAGSVPGQPPPRMADRYRRASEILDAVSRSTLNDR